MHLLLISDVRRPYTVALLRLAAILPASLGVAGAIFGILANGTLFITQSIGHVEHTDVQVEWSPYHFGIGAIKETWNLNPYTSTEFDWWFERKIKDGPLIIPFMSFGSRANPNGPGATTHFGFSIPYLDLVITGFLLMWWSRRIAYSSPLSRRHGFPVTENT